MFLSALSGAVVALALVAGAMIAGVIAAIVGIYTGLDTRLALGLVVEAAVMTVALLVSHQYRRVVRPRGLQEPRFPEGQTGSSATNR